VDQKIEWQLRRELAATYRLVHHFRMTDLIFTHISLRLPGPEPTFLINPYGLHCSMTAPWRSIRLAL
jgi:ribulose-5-phosphate 4-epimerase/fuculose-1-phosphate aldolase